MRFSLSHILAPRQSPAEFFAMARALGGTDVEIRNDTPNVVGTIAAADVRAAAKDASVNVLSINALYPFNVWNEERRAQTTQLARYAADCGAKALVMCPLNEGKPVAKEALVAALAEIKPILIAHGIKGLVEPLGFEVSSLRSKADAIAAIKAAAVEKAFSSWCTTPSTTTWRAKPSSIQTGPGWCISRALRTHRSRCPTCWTHTACW